MIDDLVAGLKAKHDFLKPVDSHQELTEGFSSDRKHLLQVDGVPTYLLRLSDIEYAERRRNEFDLMAVHFRNGIACPEPFTFGITPDGVQCYSINSYIPGESAERALPGLSVAQQYQAGYQAGNELWKLHQLPGKETHAAWLKRRREKYRRRKQEAKDLQLTFSDQERIERFCEADMNVLDDSPVRYQHDDYHVGNLVIHDGVFAGVIDFNRSDWGDPVEDFYKVPWFSEPVSQPFAQGQIEAYLAKEDPKGFWLRYNLFVAMNLHGSLVYEHQYGCESYSRWQLRIDYIVRTHDFENGVPPSWFTVKVG